MTAGAKYALLKLAITASIVILIVYNNPIADAGYAIFIVPAMFLAIYIWLGVAFFFFELVWTLATKPGQRLFATVMLTGTVFVTVALAAIYWLIRDSIGLGAAIAYAFGAYFVLSIVRWFRRHTAHYYESLENEKHSADGSQTTIDKSG